MQLFQLKSRRQKFSHRIAFWNKLTGYVNRPVMTSGIYLDTIKYAMPSAVMAGKKIVFFSDLHWPGGNKLQPLVDELARVIIEQQPDYTIFGGDIISHACHLDAAAQSLQRLPEIGLKLACPGNWDRAKTWLSAERWKQYYANAGFKLLINERFDGGNAIFYGCDDIKTGHLLHVENKLFPDSSDSCGSTLPAVDEPHSATSTNNDVPLRKYHIILAHSPDSAVNLCNLSKLKETDLILSGHTHGGQVRFPVIGAVKTSSRYRRKFDYGHYSNKKTGTQLIVTSGLGTSLLPLRWNCRPEVVIIDFIASK